MVYLREKIKDISFLAVYPSARYDISLALEFFLAFAVIKDLGMNVVRMFLLWDDFQPEPTSVSSAAIDNLVKIASRTFGKIDAIVNNAAWVRWIQDIAVAHWRKVAPEEHREAYIWVVTRHEIDYLRAAYEGDRLLGRTWVGDAPKGARFDRYVEFAGNDGRPCVRARTGWAIIDKASGRPIRVPPQVVAPFVTAR